MTDRTAPDISPVYGDLRGLAPLVMVIGFLDVALEDNMALAVRMSAARRVQVDLRIYPVHGTASLPIDRHGQAVLRDIECWLAGRFSAASS